MGHFKVATWRHSRPAAWAIRSTRDWVTGPWLSTEHTSNRRSDVTQDHGKHVHDTRRPRCLPEIPRLGQAVVRGDRHVAKDVAQSIRRRHDRSNGPTILHRSPQGLD